MKKKVDEEGTQEYKKGFEESIIEKLEETCLKYIEGVRGPTVRNRQPSKEDSGDEEGEIETAASYLASLLFDFSRNLQKETSLVRTFDLVEKACDSIKSKLEAIKYCKWNRLPVKKYKNVYNQILQRKLDPSYTGNREDGRGGFKTIFRNFERKVNIWAHHVLFDDFDADKSYNEPPQIQIVRFDVTGEVLITGGSEGIIKLWDTCTFKNIMSLKKHSGAISNIDVHPTNAFIASSCEGGEIWLWEINNNYYRPHRMVKSTYKFLWVRFLVHEEKKVRSRVEACGRMDRRDRENWERSLEGTRIVSLDANSVLRVYRMRDLLSSSAGDNIYTEVTPEYYVDLFNHNITAYDLSKASFNGTFLMAIGIEPLDIPDLNKGDFEDINSAFNFMKNDTFHKTDLNIKGRYKNLIGKSGFALLMLPLEEMMRESDEDEGERQEWCVCDAPMKQSRTCVNICMVCGRPKYRENKKESMTISHFEGKEKIDQKSSPISMFIWTSEKASEIEKFFIETIPDFKFYNEELYEGYSPTIPVMHYGKITSSMILPSCPGTGGAYERESPDFDKLFLNFVNDAHLLSPDVCFANKSANHVSASDDGKVFIWSYENEGFKSRQLSTKTLEKWKKITGMKDDDSKNESKNIMDYKEQWKEDNTYKTTDRKRGHRGEAHNKSVSNNVNNKSGNQGSKKASESDNKDKESAVSNVLYVVVGLSWSSRDRYVSVADSLVTKYNYRKQITQARTNYSGVSFFDKEGKRVGDFMHEWLTYHVSCVAFNPECEEVCVIGSYDGVIQVVDVKEGTTVKRFNFGTTSIWMDIQWHPKGHKFVACQKYGSFSVFSGENKNVYERTPNYQCKNLDYFCNTLSYPNSAYAGPESNEERLKKYYSSFTNAPITLKGDESYEKIIKTINGGPVIFLDENRNNVVIHITGGVRRCELIAYEYDENRELEKGSGEVSVEDGSVGTMTNELYGTLCKINGFREYFEGHYREESEENMVKIIRQFLEVIKINERNKEENKSEMKYQSSGKEEREFKCYLGECTICEGYVNVREKNQKYMNMREGYAQLKSVTDERGTIVKTLPPSVRPQGLAETVGEVNITPTRRGDQSSYSNNSSSRSLRVVETPSREEGARPRLVPDNIFSESIILENNTIFEINTESGRGEVMEVYEQVKERGQRVRVTEEQEDEEEDDDDEEYYQDQEVEEEETEEEDEDLDLEEEEEDELMENRYKRRSERILKGRLKNQEIRKSTRILKKEEESKEKYSFRRKRGKEEYSKEKQVESSRIMSINMGSIEVRYERDDKGEEYKTKICLFCGMGKKEEYGYQTRNQSQKLSGTLFKKGKEFKPGCKLFEDVIIGPMKIPKRFELEMEEYYTISKRVESISQIYAHTSCLITSQVKLDHFNKLLNLPEVLVKSSFEVCRFCDSKFATVVCSKCGEWYHYPCAIAEYAAKTIRDNQLEEANKFDALVCGVHKCVKCLEREEEGYMTSECFLSRESRLWLVDREDAFENGFNIQMGDYVVLTNDTVFGRLNVHITWVTRKDYPILARVVDITYIFTGNLEVMACVLVDSVFGEFEEFCVFVNEKTKVVLLRDFLMSVYKVSKLEVRERVRCKVEGEVVEAEVKVVKFNAKEEKLEQNHCDKEDHHDNEAEKDNCDKAEAENWEEVEIKEVKKIVEGAFEVGSSAVNVEIKGKSKWVNAWDLCVEGDENGEIKEESFSPKDKHLVLELLRDPKYDPFYIIEEYEVSSESWISSYWKNVERPIGIKEIVEKMFNDYYRTPEGVYGEVKLLAENTKRFNAANSKYTKLSVELENRVKKLKENLESKEEWRVILAKIWPKIKKLVNTFKVKDKEREKRKVDRKGYKEDLEENGVEKGSQNRRKRKIIEGPVRRSLRIVNTEKKVEESAKRRKRTHYNLR